MALHGGVGAHTANPLDPGAAVCKRRNELRDPEEQFFFDGYDALRATMIEGFGDRGWWLDTSNQTAEETIAAILGQAATRARLDP